MPAEDPTARRIREIADANPHLNAKEIARQVGCSRSRVTEVLQAEAVSDQARPQPERAESDRPEPIEDGWIKAGVALLAAAGLIVGLGGPSAPLPAIIAAAVLIVLAGLLAPMGEAE